MEKTLFDWKDWDLIDTLVFCFYNCNLKIPIGKFAAGCEVGCIVMDYEKGIMVISDYEDNEYKFTLNLQIGEPVSA